MITSRNFRSIVILFVVLCSTVTFAGKKPEKNSTGGGNLADSGSFGVYVNGQRVASEVFRIEQSQAGAVVKSDFKTEVGNKIRQSAELSISANGDLKRYSWRESAPGKGEIVVEPSGEFLIEHVTPDPPEKPSMTTFLLSVSAPVLDDYMFSHRQILIWRYMAQSCGSVVKSGCEMPKTQFGAFVPRQHSSASLTAEYRGKEKVQLKDTERLLDRFDLTLEGDEWNCYLDENMKLVKVVIPAEKVEVLRD